VKPQFLADGFQIGVNLIKRGAAPALFFPACSSSDREPPKFYKDFPSPTLLYFRYVSISVVKKFLAKDAKSAKKKRENILLQMQSI